MNIAILHYHLLRGGVTTVIRHQVEVLNDAGWNVLVLSGSAGDQNFPAKVITLPELAYDSSQTSNCTSDNIANKIITTIENHWPGGADVLHVHNPTLAKNQYLQDVLDNLQQSGIRLLCQIHDFAEDGRLSAFYTTPYVRDCHYAVINERDHRLLLNAGLEPGGCHLLPNAVTPIKGRVNGVPRSEDVLYPIRAIRRKNIGEALLLSHFFDEGTFLNITLPPNSATDAQSYAFWRSYAKKRNLPVRFDVGVQAVFSQLMADCRYVLTTSITEGFGFVYLEPWTAGKALWGRLLPETCKGFIDLGIELEHLYTRLLVDLKWLDTDALERRWKAAMSNAARRLHVALGAKELENSWQSVSRDGRIDFGLLSESFQQNVIDRILDDPTAAAALRKLNPFLDRPAPPDTIGPVTRRNSAIISETSLLGHYGPRLTTVYRSVAGTDISHSIDKQVVSRFFLSPRYFSLLKWEPFHG